MVGGNGLFGHIVFPNLCIVIVKCLPNLAASYLLVVNINQPRVLTCGFGLLYHKTKQKKNLSFSLSQWRRVIRVRRDRDPL
jgi:hypothetical protein